jgi:hypothetical protein
LTDQKPCPLVFLCLRYGRYGNQKRLGGPVGSFIHWDLSFTFPDFTRAPRGLCLKGFRGGSESSLEGEEPQFIQRLPASRRELGVLTYSQSFINLKLKLAAVMKLMGVLSFYAT